MESYSVLTRLPRPFRVARRRRFVLFASHSRMCPSQVFRRATSGRCSKNIRESQHRRRANLRRCDRTRAREAGAKAILTFNARQFWGEGLEVLTMTSLLPRLTRFLTQLISETSGLSLDDTLVLAQQSPQLDDEPDLGACIGEFHDLLGRFRSPRRRSRRCSSIPSRMPSRPFSAPFRFRFTTSTFTSPAPSTRSSSIRGSRRSSWGRSARCMKRRSARSTAAMRCRSETRATSIASSASATKIASSDI